MSVLKIPSRHCAMCKIEISYSEYMKSYGLLMGYQSTSDILEKNWNDETIPVYCDECVHYSRLDVNLCLDDEKDLDALLKK